MGSYINNYLPNRIGFLVNSLDFWVPYWYKKIHICKDGEKVSTVCINTKFNAMITSWKNISLLSYLLLALMTASCQSANSETSTEGFQDLNVVEFKEKMDTRGVVILDVRTPEETAEGKIDGAQELDFRAPDFQEKLGQLDRDKTYLVYCRSGGRSSSACSMMDEMGFTNVYNLVGGYQGWSAEN